MADSAKTDEATKQAVLVVKQSAQSNLISRETTATKVLLYLILESHI